LEKHRIDNLNLTIPCHDLLLQGFQISIFFLIDSEITKIGIFESIFVGPVWYFQVQVGIFRPRLGGPDRITRAKMPAKRLLQPLDRLTETLADASDLVPNKSICIDVEHRTDEGRMVSRSIVFAASESAMMDVPISVSSNYSSGAHPSSLHKCCIQFQ
jgi:hypothetical protein